MAIRFDPAYNTEIRRVVRNFNQKRNRAIKRGFTNLPPALTVSELKSRYTKKADLDRDLKLISQFNKEDALETVETAGGVKAINWEMKYLKANIKKTREFLDREIQKLSLLDTDLVVTKRELLNNLIDKRAHLDLELNMLAPSQFATYKSIINEYLGSNYSREKAYRGWMNELETIMGRLGYSKKTINKFFKGFDKLSPSQFVTMYRQNNLISRLYELYLPVAEGDWQLSTSEEDAKELIDTFMIEKDEMIARAKNETSMIEGRMLKEFSKSIEKSTQKNLAERRKMPKKIKRKDLTKKQLEALKELGWEDIIE